MTMDAFLLENKLIDLKGLALLKYKSLGLDEHEIIVILVIMTLEPTGKNMIGYSSVLEYVGLESRKVDQIMVSLVNKKMIQVIGTSISLDDFYKKLLFDDNIRNDVVVNDKAVNLVEAFENEFAKALTPMELETLRGWKQIGYDDQMILNALKEASLSNVQSFRYIEKILINWARDGVKRTKFDDEPIDDEEFVEYRWWEDLG